MTEAEEYFKKINDDLKEIKSGKLTLQSMITFLIVFAGRG